MSALCFRSLKILFLAVIASVALVLSATISAQVKVVVIPLGGDDFAHTDFLGPQRNLKQAELESVGWSICYSDLYAEDLSTQTIFSQCSKANMMLACRPTGSNTFTLAAYGPKGEILSDTGQDETTTNRVNGSQWYFNTNYSWGFAPGGEAVIKASADVLTIAGDFRLSWHTVNTVGGYRCGADLDLNLSSDFERVVLHRD